LFGDTIKPRREFTSTKESGPAFSPKALQPEREGLLNQIFKPLRAETADIDLAFVVDDLLRKRHAGGDLLSLRHDYNGPQTVRIVWDPPLPVTAARGAAVFSDRND
jgi:hypothetical protein